MRLLRTSDLTRLFFSAKGTCQKRLRKLYDAGLVRAVVTDLATENRYAISRLGHALLEQAIEHAVVPAFRPAPRIDGRSVAHLDFLNAFRIALAMGVHEHGVELRGFIPDWELRAKDPLATLVPDAMIAVASSGGVNALACALEIDTGAEAVGVVLKKLVKYRERRALGQNVFGFSPELVLLLTRTERRARTLARQIVQAGADGAAPVVALGVEETVLEGGGVVTGLSLPGTLMGEGERKGAFDRGLISLGL